jgi:hypothetical protein
MGLSNADAAMMGWPAQPLQQKAVKPRSGHGFAAGARSRNAG